MPSLVTESKSHGAAETLQRLLNVNDDDYSSGEEFPPTTHAVEMASNLLLEANLKVKKISRAVPYQRMALEEFAFSGRVRTVRFVLSLQRFPKGAVTFIMSKAMITARNGKSRRRIWLTG